MNKVKKKKKTNYINIHKYKGTQMNRTDKTYIHNATYSV